MGEGEESFVSLAEASKASSRGILAPHTSNFELLSPSGKAIVTAMVGRTYFMLGLFRIAMKPMTNLSQQVLLAHFTGEEIEFHRGYTSHPGPHS